MEENDHNKTKKKAPPSWTLYLNGEFVPFEEARISIFDVGFIKGDAIFDCGRTAGHKPFRLEEHIQRLYRNLKFAKIDPGLSPEEMKQLCLQVLEKNVHLMRENDDCWIFMRITRGMRRPDSPFNYPYGLLHYKPTVIVFVSPINFREFARIYFTGRKLITSSIRAFPSECLEPRLKSQCRQHFHLAIIEAEERDPTGWPLMLDIHGNIAEPYGANIFFVRDGELLTPSSQMCLEGVSRQTVIELAREMGIPLREGSCYKPYDLYIAEEAFVTTTSYCVLPVCSLDGIKIGRELPGPITLRLIEGFGKKMGVDLIQQALSHLSEEERRDLQKEYPWAKKEEVHP
ncbi:MAG TPA: aminotransferase class IV [Spirochaetia bacterium]|nr:aminotransferase class IV [Spirochaetia bacterium]